mgnify:CR=1 FL=1
MTHAHVWKIDGRGRGECACGERRQFMNSWEAIYQQRFNRPIEEVQREMALLYSQYHPPRVASPHRMTRISLR